MNKIIYYSNCSNGSVDVIINVNGHDLHNYNYADIDVCKMDFSENEYDYVCLDNEEYEV